ncbi:ABC transporter substrate-binding protein [Natronorubrum sp. JWXQ-INN-674]|uniref:ABC transporter substrate-binding protein n=1 Tax=Natronorubrum halalkaliphilum TaxID=2691917 RepID=A0A6B0VS65_9EURY|nr:PGF-CTERM-anchored ABC transporter substrate-binding protein [Natronorubrum halalkaliphilum]MXV64388.1 ABC transporter substrate-binding protein [Natronorubrum halalkaliphilum]
MRQKFVVLITALLTLSLFAPAVAGAGAGAGTGVGLDASAAAQSDEMDCEYPLEVTDATGETITLDEPPESVVALQPSDAQTVFEIGAEDRLTGMPDNPATADLEMGDREAITDGYEIIHERVIDLEPDVVLAANATFDDDIDTLRQAGLDVYHFDEAESVDDVRDNVFQTGELTDECDGAEETVDWMDERLETVETALEDADRPLAYYAMGDDGTTAGTETFIHEVLTTAGVENIGERAGISGYEQLSEETLVEEDPDWIIHSDDAEPEVLMPDIAESTSAYQDGNVIAVDANQLNQPAPQVVYAVVDIVEAVHPDAYEAAVEGLEDTESDDSATDENGDDASDTDADEDDDAAETIPGFGIPVAVAALLGTAFLARRR